ncbi:MAG: UbiD family decarboxylase, partial [Rickettsiales bacterium]|nr:UbiD family decarboxylase [Rickettsiales bacterium]
MAYTSLRDFMEALEQRGLLKRVKTPVSPHLEMTEIHRRVLAAGGQALLFEQVVQENGSASMPVLVNLFGTVERIAMAMGTTPEALREVGEMLAFLRQPEPPGGLREAMELIPLLKKAMAMKPKTVKSAPCQDVVLEGDAIDLAKLPVQTCWPGDAAPLITWPLVVTQGPKPAGAQRDPEDQYNLGIYRMQV